MSGPGKQYDGYRCDVCRKRQKRCKDCRAARAAATRERLARKRELGICLRCTAKAIKGQRLCPEHQAINAEISKASHARARAEARE